MKRFFIGMALLLLMFGSQAYADRDDFRDPKQVAISYDASGRTEYVGKALAGKASSGADWQIQKLVYDASGRVTNVYFADDSTDYNKIWDNRSTYTYD